MATTRSNSSIDCESNSEVSSNCDEDTASLRTGPTRTSQRAGASEESTAWLAPEQPARRLLDGKYARPAGRPPVDGYEWNAMCGVWVPGPRLRSEMESQMSQHEIRRRPPKRRGDSNRQPSTQSASRRKRASRSIAIDSPPVRNLNESYQKSVTRRKHSPIRAKGLGHGDFDSIAEPMEQQRQRDCLEDSERNLNESAANIDTDAAAQHESENPASPNPCEDDSDMSEAQICDSSMDDPYHPSSAWKEPAPADYEPQLTLYERHRKARPAPTGSFKCSIQALRQEFRCVICLDYIQSARIVRECLHRFCEQCIEKALTQVGRRNECPICRVFIPSRRSLAPDPNFDLLIHRILRNLIRSEEDDDDDNMESSPQDSMIASQNFPDADPQREPSPEIEKKCEGQLLDDADMSDERGEDGGSQSSDALGEQSLPTEQKDNETPNFIKLVLLLDDQDKLLDNLRQPFLTICGDAPVRVLKSFLRQKYGFITSSFEIWSTWNGKPKCHSDSTTLLDIFINMTDDFEGVYMPLHYRVL